MIIDLSHQPSFTINEHIDPQFALDTVVQTISTLGPRALLVKLDIKNAFCLLPIYPGDFEPLGIYIYWDYYTVNMLVLIPFLKFMNSIFCCSIGSHRKEFFFPT